MTAVQGAIESCQQRGTTFYTLSIILFFSSCHYALILYHQIFTDSTLNRCTVLGSDERVCQQVTIMTFCLWPTRYLKQLLQTLQSRLTSTFRILFLCLSYARSLRFDANLPGPYRKTSIFWADAHHASRVDRLDALSCRIGSCPDRNSCVAS